MQKKLIALAVAGLASTAAFAQTNVTIYGVADAAYVASSGGRLGSNNGGDLHYKGVNSGGLSGSRIGFRGEEGLGNGLKAVFTLEYGVSIDNNSGVGSVASAGTASAASDLNSRQAFVGLSHDKLGTVALGRQYAPGFYASGRNDAFLGSTVVGTTGTLQGTGYNTIHASSNARWDNAVTYTSPVWSGFQVRAAYSFAENNTNATGTDGNPGVSVGSNSRFGAGLNYANGPLNLDLVFQQRNDLTNNGLNNNALRTAGAGAQNAGVASVATGDSVSEWYVGGSYDFKVVKLLASYQDLNDKNGTSAQEASNKVWNVGAVVPVFGNGKIHASYGKISWDRTGAGDSTSWALGYTHALSKRTTLYAAYSAFDNDNNVVNAAGIVANTKNLGEKNGTFAAGLNHSF